MATNLDILANSVNQYIVTPVNAFGLGGFVFDNEGETSINLTSEITDHYLEDNSAIQDHISIRPKKLTLKSYVGELVYREDDASNTFVQKVVQKLTTLASYLPTLTTAATQAIDFIKEEKVSDFSLGNVTLETVNKTTDYWAFIKNLGNQASRQQQAYMYFKALQEGKFLVSVQTPFEFLNNMAIESVLAVQSENSKYISDFSIVLKQIRTVSILNVEQNESVYNTRAGTPEELNQGRSLYQTQDLNQVGNMPGLDVYGNQVDARAANIGRMNSPAQPLRISVDDLIEEYGEDIRIDESLLQ